MTTLRFNEAAAGRLERLYSTPDVRGQRDEALRHLALSAGESVVDVGCGPGFLCESMAAMVGPNGRVLGVDVSDDLLEAARRRNSSAQLAYAHGDAMALAIPEASADVVVSMQVLEYLPDVDRAIGEMHRILKPGGRALVVATDWDAVVWHSCDRARMARVMRAWEAHCTDPRLPRTLRPRLAGRFRVEKVVGYPIVNTRLGEDTYSDGIMRLLVEFVRRQKSLAAEELDAWADDLQTLSEQGRYFFALTRFLFLASKA